MNAPAERCTFHDDHDPVTHRPRGNRCTATAVEEILWTDGRTSVACEQHGLDALDEDARALVAEARSLPGSAE